MKEIIYIQAGNVSNHIGTHFWNTQESYFTYDNDSEPLVNHDISFREGLSNQNEPTYCPRVLIFDHKSNFGPLSKYNELYPDMFDADQSFQKGLWNGPVSEYRQEAIPQSDYLKRLETAEDNDVDNFDNVVVPSKIRYWSDFNRLYYHPRSVQQVSDLPDWQANKGDWNYGRSVFERYNLDNSLNDVSLRRLLEESNNSQGFQMSFDNSSFGGFSVALLETIRDEHPKLPVLAFPLLSGVDPIKTDSEDTAMRKLALQDAACICVLDDLATQSISICLPASWRLGKWSKHLSFDTNNLYQSSAIISAHSESATLPLRLKGRHDDLYNLCNHLNWTQNTRFSHLSGVLPFIDDAHLNEVMHDFSTVIELKPQHANQCLVQRNISRGLTIEQARSVEAYFASSTVLEEPYLDSIHAPSYPLPTSFPNIFAPRSTPSSEPKITHPSGGAGRSISLISTLRTTASTATILQGYMALSRACTLRRYSGMDAAGLEADEIREMVEKLEIMADAYVEEKAKISEEGEDDEGEDEGLD